MLVEHAWLESAGFLWLLAEALILVAMRAGRRALHELDASGAIRFRGLRHDVTVVAGIALAIALAEALRFAYPLLALDPEQRERFSRALYPPIWAAYVLGWVLLESAIVYTGYRGWQELRRLLSQRAALPRAWVMPGMAVVLAATLFGILGPMTAQVVRFAPTDTALETIDAAENLVYAWIRYAAVVWIAVEWIAAVVLVQAFYDCRCSLRALGHRV